MTETDKFFELGEGLRVGVVVDGLEAGSLGGLDVGE